MLCLISECFNKIYAPSISTFVLENATYAANQNKRESNIFNIPKMKYFTTLSMKHILFTKAI